MRVISLSKQRETKLPHARDSISVQGFFEIGSWSIHFSNIKRMLWQRDFEKGNKEVYHFIILLYFYYPKRMVLYRFYEKALPPSHSFSQCTNTYCTGITTVFSIQLAISMENVAIITNTYAPYAIRVDAKLTTV